MISNCQKYLAIRLTFICVIVLYPQSTYATEAISQRETIRVGFFEMDEYAETTRAEPCKRLRSGCCR